MNCSKCRKSALPNVEYAGKKYCEHHFLELMEKRVRKNLRIRELINVNEEYILVDDNSSEAKVTEYFLNKIFRGYLKLKVVRPSAKIQGLNVIVPTNLDEQSIEFLSVFLNNSKTKAADGGKKQENSRRVMPLEVLMQSEVEILCKILGIKFVPRVNNDILDSLEERHKGTKFSLFQSRMNLLDLRKITKEKEKTKGKPEAKKKRNN